MFIKFQDLVYTNGSRAMPWNPSLHMKVYYYLVDGLLVDSGPSSLAGLAIAFFNAHPISQVFLTHVHEDHSGMAYWIQENKKLPIYLHPDSIEEASRESEFPAYRLDIWGKRRAFQAVPTPDSLSTGRHLFHVIDSPGHCPCHQVLYEKNKGWLFSGDLLNNLRPTSVFCEENLSDMILSIQKITALDFETVFCPHAGILPKGKQLFVQKLTYLLGLQQKIGQLRKQGLRSEEIVQQLFPRSLKPNPVLGADFSPYYIVNTL